MHTGLRYLICLCLPLMASQAFAQDMSGWSDKTVCRLIKSGGGQEHLDEAKSRGIDCELPLVKGTTSKNTTKTKNKTAIDSNATTDGRWRGIVVCDRDKEQWGGGEYKLGNGKLSGKIDFTVNNGTIKATNRDYLGRGRFWFDWSGGGHKIQSFKISKQKITIESKTPHDGYTSNWEADLITNNTLNLVD